MRCTPLLLLLALVAAPNMVAAQSSQLSVSGLGIPGRNASVRSWATGGSFTIFDGESSLNPAALSTVGAVTATFSGLTDFRRIESPAGDASTQSVRFPQFSVAGGVRNRPLFFGVSYSSYAMRDFTFGVTDTVNLRGVPVEVGDTFSSRGGIGDIQLGTAYRLGRWWAAGAGLHIITGSNRLLVGRGFGDAAYVGTRQLTEVAYSGVGISVGVMGQLAPSLAVAAMARADGHLDVTRNEANDGTIDLPYTFAAGLRWRPATRLDLDGQVVARTWSAANSDLQERGGVGAKNTVEVGVGGEFVSDSKRPYRRPLRFGVRYALLPFLVNEAAGQPHEFGVSIGSGTRFAADRGGFDLALERLWRSAGSNYTEHAWLLLAGVTIRP